MIQKKIKYINESIEDDGKTEKLPENGEEYSIKHEDYYTVAGFKFNPKIILTQT